MGRPRHRRGVRGRARDRRLGAHRDEAGAERRRQRPMGRARPDEHRARRVDAVRTREGERQPGERRAAPAGRRAGAVRADAPRSTGPDTLGGEARRPRRRARPGSHRGSQSKTRCGAPVSIAVERVDASPACRSAGGRDEDARPRPPGGRRAHERHALDLREAPRRSTAARARGARASGTSAPARPARAAPPAELLGRRAASRTDRAAARPG